MKILLIGEFSGFHNNLKDGLIALGHECVVAGKKDGSKKIKVDFDLDSNFKGFIGKIDRIIKSLIFSLKAVDYDVVQFINPVVFPRGLGLNRRLIKYIIKNNKKSFLSSCGDDAFFIEVGSKKMRYSPLSDALEYDLKLNYHPDGGLENFAWNKELITLVNGVIPVMYEYALGYEGVSNLYSCIPLPINCSKISYIENKPSEKILIFHGLNRYGFKGTRHVEKAFNYLSNKYPEDVECIISGGMSLSDYLSLMKRVNIVIDQTYSYSCGMNALYAMAMGKIVLGGAEPESLNAYGIKHSPVINIKPNSKDIIKNVERLLALKSKIPELGCQSRTFVEKLHECQVVAMNYLDSWSN